MLALAASLPAFSPAAAAPALSPAGRGLLLLMADRIERGEHLKGEE
jgi:hypothetical protein